MNYNFDHFLDPQKIMYEKALSEPKAGKKRSHWMWFIFPQTKKPNVSEVSKYYAIGSLDVARVYFEHPILGLRLKECAEILLSYQNLTAIQIFGALDSMKLKSSMLLFSHVDKSGVFHTVLDRYFKSRVD